MPLLAPAVVALLLAAQTPETVAETVISAAPATETPALETAAVPAAAETSAAESPTASGGRLLLPGDEIRVVVADQSEEMTLNPDGEVFLTGLGAVRLAGRAAPDAARHLAREIRSAGFDVADTQVVVFLVRSAPEPDPPRAATPPREAPLTADSGVTVLGEVARPGIHPAGRLTAVLAAAGGTTDRAAWRLSVRLADGATERHDLYAVLRSRAPDAEISAGAVLHVPRSVNPLTILRDLLGIGAAVGRVAQ